MLYLARSSLRTQQAIPDGTAPCECTKSCCTGGVEAAGPPAPLPPRLSSDSFAPASQDCCCALCCGACTQCQMMRQVGLTGDGKYSLCDMHGGQGSAAQV